MSLHFDLNAIANGNNDQTNFTTQLLKVIKPK